MSIGLGLPTTAAAWVAEGRPCEYALHERLLGPVKNALLDAAEAAVAAARKAAYQRTRGRLPLFVWVEGEGVASSDALRKHAIRWGLSPMAEAAGW